MLALAAMILVCAGCSGREKSGAESRRRSITVFAASSLTEVFTRIGEEFERASPGRQVTFTFGASSSLARQIADGARADVFAAADDASMGIAVDARGGGQPVPFARNELSILVETGNPRGVSSLADITDPDVVLVLCAPEVPCGAYAAKAFAKSGLSPRPRSLEPNVKGVVSKVILGEADAGIVYASDAKSAGPRAEGVVIPEASDPDLQAVYSMATTTATTHGDLARAWIEFVIGPDGTRILSSFGFLAPGAQE